MIVPVAHQAAEQVGPPEDRAVGRRGAADDDVVAAAGAGVAAVEHELLGAEPREARLVVEHRGLLDELVPAVRRVHVDFDHAGVGRDLEVVEPAVRRRRRSLR